MPGRRNWPPGFFVERIDALGTTKNLPPEKSKE